MRLNQLIATLEGGEVAFGGGFVPANAHVDTIVDFIAVGHDFVVVETEHLGFDAATLRQTLRLLVRGDPGGHHPTPVVRIPPAGRELSPWFVKQALDAGALGIVFPHVETVEEARQAVRASRYPQPRGSGTRAPEGARGWWSRTAPRLWGLSPDEYYRRAGVWPLDADGEIFVMLLIESPLGVENVDAMLSDVAGIGAVWIGTGDLSVTSGAGVGNGAAVEQAVEHVLDRCCAHGIPCCIAPRLPDLELRLRQGFRLVVSQPALGDAVLEQGRRLTTGTTREPPDEPRSSG